MGTYERVFKYIKPSYGLQQDGHAQRNIENKKSLALAKKEIENIISKHLEALL